MAPETLHVTLRFLGDVDAGTLDRLIPDLANAALQCGRFSIQLPELRAVPSAERASMIWAKVLDRSGRCDELARAIRRVALRNGLAGESKPFTPHVTLVRARRVRPVAPETLATALIRASMGTADSVSVLSATLFSSELTPLGPHHTALAEFALRAE